MLLDRLKLTLEKLTAGIRRTQDQARLGAAHAEQAAGHSAMTQLTLADFADRALQLQGQMAARAQPKSERIEDLSKVEFRVYSQWGEDGIIEWLVNHVPCASTRFVEFGVATFREANCRFILQNRNWTGLVLDGSEANMTALQGNADFWMHDLTAKAAFVTADNINALLHDSGFAGELGILSIDIDGNDYWVWKAIVAVNPAIVICEVNSVFGDTVPVTVPYKADFNRFDAHYSGLCFGASIAALRSLGEQKGYCFVGTSSSGVNAFFVRRDLAAPVLELVGSARAYCSKHRDSRDRDGSLSFVGGVARAALIADCPVVDLRSGELIRFGDIMQPYSDEWLQQMN